MLPRSAAGPSKWKPVAPKSASWAARMRASTSKIRPESVKMAFRVSKNVPSWALTAQFLALNAPENDFWCPWGPPELILKDPELLF